MGLELSALRQMGSPTRKAMGRRPGPQPKRPFHARFAWPDGEREFTSSYATKDARREAVIKRTDEGFELLRVWELT